MKDSDDIQGLGFKGILQGGVGRVGCGEKGAFGFRRVGGLDPDAAAYIAQLEGTGVTVSGGQKSALDTFFRAEKAASRWDLHKRLYLPIWAQAAANAICMRSLTSGTWANAPTMGAGFVQGNGTNQYFNFGTDPVALGCATGDASLFALVKSYTSGGEQGLVGSVSGGIVEGNQLRLLTTNANFVHPNISGQATVAAETGGIYIGSATTTSNRFALRRGAAGATSASNTSTQTTALTTQTIFAMCRNLNAGVPNSYSNAQFGGFGAGLGLSIGEAEDFTANLQTLWETCTGLTLP